MAYLPRQKQLEPANTPTLPQLLYTGLKVLLTSLYFLTKTRPTLVHSGVPLEKHGTSLHVLSPSGQVTYYHLVGGGYVCVRVNGWVWRISLTLTAGEKVQQILCVSEHLGRSTIGSSLTSFLCLGGDST